MKHQTAYSVDSTAEPACSFETFQSTETGSVASAVVTIPKRIVERFVPKQVVQERLRTVEVPQTEYEIREKEVLFYQDKIIYRPEKRIIEIPKEVERLVPKPLVKISERIVHVPGEIIEVPQPYTVEKQVVKPIYQDRLVYTAVAQTFKPVVVEGTNVHEVECIDYQPEIHEVVIYVPKLEKTNLVPGHVSHVHQLVDIPTPQFNSLLIRLNPHIPIGVDLPFRRDENGDIVTLRKDIPAGAPIGDAPNFSRLSPRQVPSSIPIQVPENNDQARPISTFAPVGPMQPQAMQAEPMQSQGMQAEQMQAEPMHAELMQAEQMQAEQMQANASQADPAGERNNSQVRDGQQPIVVGIPRTFVVNNEVLLAPSPLAPYAQMASTVNRSWSRPTYTPLANSSLPSWPPAPKPEPINRHWNVINSDIGREILPPRAVDILHRGGIETTDDEEDRATVTTVLEGVSTASVSSARRRAPHRPRGNPLLSCCSVKRYSSERKSKVCAWLLQI